VGRGATSAALLLWTIERDWTLARRVGFKVQRGLRREFVEVTRIIEVNKNINKIKKTIMTNGNCAVKLQEDDVKNN